MNFQYIHIEDSCNVSLVCNTQGRIAANLSVLFTSFLIPVMTCTSLHLQHLANCSVDTLMSTPFPESSHLYLSDNYRQHCVGKLLVNKPLTVFVHCFLNFSQI